MGCTRSPFSGGFRCCAFCTGPVNPDVIPTTLGRRMYMRFVTNQTDSITGLPRGVFAAAYDITRDEANPAYIRSEICSTLDWFVENLPVPERLRRSRKPHREDKGLCWFKTDAGECIKRVRYLAYLVAECDVNVRELTTTEPGYTIYEDHSQLVAEPFGSTPR